MSWSALLFVLAQSPPGSQAPPAPAAYQSPRLLAPVDPAEAERHDGFFLRFSFGFGFSSLRARPDAASNRDSWLMRGHLMVLDLAAGWALRDNLILFTNLDLDTVVPTKLDPRLSPRTGRTRVWLGGLGAGLAYYWMPHNLHLSAGVQFASLSLEEPPDNVVGVSQPGLGGTLALGKEWWLTPTMTANWSAGIGLVVRWARMKDDTLLRGLTPPPTWTSMSVALLLSMTYN